MVAHFHNEEEKMPEQRAKSTDLFDECRFLVWCGVFFMALAIAGFCVVTLSGYNMGWKTLALVAGVMLAWASIWSIMQGFATKKMARLWKNLEDCEASFPPTELNKLYETMRYQEELAELLEGDVVLVRKLLGKTIEEIENELRKQ